MIAEIIDVLQFVGVWAGVSVGGAGTVAGVMTINHRRFQNKIQKKEQAAIASRTTDGRLDTEWYDLIKGMGKEEYERLSRGALDGLEESKVHKWDAEKLMGKTYFDKLMREWYPERYEVKKPAISAEKNMVKKTDFMGYQYYVNEGTRAIASAFGTPKITVDSYGMSISSIDHDPVRAAKKRVTIASLQDMCDLQKLLGVQQDSLFGINTQRRMSNHILSTSLVGNNAVYFINVNGKNFVLTLNVMESFNANGCKKYYIKKLDGPFVPTEHSARENLAKMAVHTFKAVH